MREITITYDGKDKEMKMVNLLNLEAVIMLNEALEHVCFELDMPFEQAVSIAYTKQEQGQLFKEEEE